MMGESITTRLLRWKFNFFPAYRGTGARITYIAKDWREVRVKLPLNWRTRNYVGTIYGGSIYGAIDPIYMVMLIRLLGHEYIVWDKSASITFKRPGKSTLYANFIISKAETEEIIKVLTQQTSIERIYQVEMIDLKEVVHANIVKTIYIRHRSMISSD
jgi:acyl-coenzyme A thioesterase PaaI-like protein